MADLTQTLTNDIGEKTRKRGRGPSGQWALLNGEEEDAAGSETLPWCGVFHHWAEKTSPTTQGEGAFHRREIKTDPTRASARTKSKTRFALASGLKGRPRPREKGSTHSLLQNVGWPEKRNRLRPGTRSGDTRDRRCWER